MNDQQITAADAEEMVLEWLRQRYQPRVEQTECPTSSGVLGYGITIQDPTDYFFFYVEPDRPRTGPAQLICISRLTGEIVFDGEVGE